MLLYSRWFNSDARWSKVLHVACKLQAVLYRDSVLRYLRRVILRVECTASAHRTIALVMRRPQGDGRLLWLLQPVVAHS